MLIYTFGTSRLPMKYSDSELSEVIQRIFKTVSTSIPFSQLCSQIIDVALKENKLAVDGNVQYAKIEVTQEDGCRISRVLWDLIWNRKIYIDFHSSQGSNGFNEFYFKKIE
jgi:hypothetical protein